jgi:hypothetical protein
MRNDCLDREKIFALAQRMLSGRAQQEASSHIDSCDQCRSVLRSYQRLDSVLDEWSPAAEPSPRFDARLRAAVEAQEARTSRSILVLSWGRWMAAPALVSLLLVAGLVALRSGRIADYPRPAGSGESKVAVVKPVAPPVPQAAAENQELKMYQNLPVLEDYDMLSSFDVISELPKGSHKIAD